MRLQSGLDAAAAGCVCEAGVPCRAQGPHEQAGVQQHVGAQERAGMGWLRAGAAAAWQLGAHPQLPPAAAAQEHAGSLAVARSGRLQGGHAELPALGNGLICSACAIETMH
jgi:hypothetical protein